MFGVHQTPKRYTLDRMPRPELVFISHTHTDHFSPSVLKRLDPYTPVWMPTSKVHKASRLGLRALRGLQAWETSDYGGVRFTAVPGRHTGGELGLVIEGDRTVYFAGDTSLDRETFLSIGNRWDLDAVLLPIGDLRILGIPIGHLGPRRVPRAIRLLGEPSIVVPTHYSGMTLGPLAFFWGKPRKLPKFLDKAQLGTLIGTTRPLQTVEI